MIDLSPPAHRRELLEAAFVALDPIYDGFSGVLLELFYDPTRPSEAEPYVLLQSAAASGEMFAREALSTEAPPGARRER